MLYRITVAITIVFITTVSFSQRTDKYLSGILNSVPDPLFQTVIQHPDSFRLQIIYTQIDRDSRNIPHFHNYYFNYDAGMYFNPASVVKLPLALLSLEKLNTLKQYGIDKFTPVLFDSSKPWQKGLYKDTTAANGYATIAHFIKRALLISENDPYNRMYQFVGQQAINVNLQKKGYKDIRITRQFLGLTPEQNRYTNAVRFVDKNGRQLYHQPPAYNTDTFNFTHQVKLGKAHYDSNDSLVNGPFDFTAHNSLSIYSLQQLLQSVMFPLSVPKQQRFDLSKNDLEFMHRYLSQYPSETPDPKYDTAKFYDSYVKFFFRNSSHKMPPGVRVFNKPGWSYGFMTDVSYVADFTNKVEFMLTATIYVNSDGVINDGKYDYASIGYPFLYQLGQTIYQYELKRKRKYKPDLSAFRIEYEKRDPADKRAALQEVDN